jgi:hypothetical protein
MTYGDDFLYHELLTSGADVRSLASELAAGRHIADIAAAQHADWRKIEGETERFQHKVQHSLYDFFTDSRPHPAKAGDYDPLIDWIAADKHGYDDDDLAWAAHMYIGERTRALRNSRNDGLDEIDYNTFHFRDHIQEDAPKATLPPAPSIPSHK